MKNQDLNQIQYLVYKEEKGSIFKLPFDVGDNVFVITKNYRKCIRDSYKCEEYDSDEYLVTWCEYFCPHGNKGIGVVEIKVSMIKVYEDDLIVATRIGDFSLEEIYTSREEAEAKLRELKSEVAKNE